MTSSINQYAGRHHAPAAANATLASARALALPARVSRALCGPSVPELVQVAGGRACRCCSDGDCKIKKEDRGNTLQNQGQSLFSRMRPSELVHDRRGRRGQRAGLTYRYSKL
eukprot:COSAG06_NODE_24121_length_672_cov_0.832461_1_plen_111_part_01